MHIPALISDLAIITCLMEVIGMMVMGYLAGSALGFSEMDSIVLGGMLAMSSTMVIIKVSEELGIKGKHVECVIVCWMPEILRSFKGKYPGIDIELSSCEGRSFG